LLGNHRCLRRPESKPTLSREDVVAAHRTAEGNCWRTLGLWCIREAISCPGQCVRRRDTSRRGSSSRCPRWAPCRSSRSAPHLTPRGPRGQGRPPRGGHGCHNSPHRGYSRASCRPPRSWCHPRRSRGLGRRGMPRSPNNRPLALREHPAGGIGLQSPKRLQSRLDVLGCPEKSVCRFRPTVNVHGNYSDESALRHPGEGKESPRTTNS